MPETTDTLATLPVRRIKSGTSVFRVSETKHSTPVFFSTSQDNRWTPKEGAPGVLYSARSETTALAETLCRDAAYLPAWGKVTDQKILESRGMYEIRLENDVQVLDLSVSNLARYRLDASIVAERSREPGKPAYVVCPAWASHALSLGLGGILYRSRNMLNEQCLALFESPTLQVSFTFLDVLFADRYLAVLDSEFGWAYRPTVK